MFVIQQKIEYTIMCTNLITFMKIVFTRVINMLLVYFINKHMWINMGHAVQPDISAITILRARISRILFFHYFIFQTFHSEYKCF